MALDHFGKNRANSDGLTAYCLACKRRIERAHASAKRNNEPAVERPETFVAEVDESKKYRPPGRGRQSAPTAELVAIVCETLQRGHTRRTAARRAGIPDGTFKTWMLAGQKGEDPIKVQFHDAVLEAEGQGEFKLLELVRESAEIDAHQAKWILERRYSQGDETWVRKEHVTVDNTNQMPEVAIVRELLATKLRGLGATVAAALGGGRQAPGDNRTDEGESGSEAPPPSEPTP